MPEKSLLALVVLLGYAIQTVSGFGCMVVALTICANFYPISTLIPIFVPLGIAQCSYILFRYRACVDRPLLLGKIIPLMTAGMLAGLYMGKILEGESLKRLFGILVSILSAHELSKLMRKSQARELPRWLFRAGLVFSGLIHGIYACGGPSLVYCISRLPLDKSSFRATLAAVWVFFNGFLLIAFANAGKYDSQNIQLILSLLPAIIAGIAVGEWLHHRVDERTFRFIVFCILLPAGASLTF